MTGIADSGGHYGIAEKKTFSIKNPKKKIPRCIKSTWVDHLPGLRRAERAASSVWQLREVQ
jgi:hypothetical protein